MTLNIPAFITNAIKKQSLIHHLDVYVKTCSPDNIPSSVKNLIMDQYGKKYLLDADYVSFFWGNLQKDDIESLFNVVDKALGKSANRLTETDFKRLKLDDEPEDVDYTMTDQNDDDEDSENSEEPEEDIEVSDDEDTEDVDDEVIDIEVSDDEESEDSEDKDTEEDADLNESKKDIEPEEDSDDEDIDIDIEDSDGEESEEDSDDEDIDIDIEDSDDEEPEQTAVPTSYMFLKITMND